MNCRTCQYALWNLRARECPECGAPFSPRDFEFVPNSVRFCCPHCGQSYYGTTEKGHLDPERFECVNCGNPTGMDEMVLLPAEGLAEHRTMPGKNLWLDSGGAGWLKAWFSTIGQALISPGQLMRGTPLESSLGKAFGFATLTQAAALLVALIPLAFIFVVPSLFKGAGPMPAGPIFLVGIGSMAAGFVFVMAIAVAWALLAHLLLVITGPERRTLRRTMQAIFYSSGANSLIATPCMGQYVGLPWWIVSATIMVKEGHGIRAGRAAFAVITPPAVLFISFVALYIAMIALMLSGARSSAAMGGWNAQQLQQVRTVVVALQLRNANNRGWPGHGSELVANHSLNAWNLVDSNSATTPVNVPLGTGTSLDELEDMTDRSARLAAASAAAAALPPGVVAHRVGDMVFTYHGIDPNTDDRRLWLVTMCADPDLDPAAAFGDLEVGRLDGSVSTIRATAFASELAAQNAIRAAANLPPLPDPRTVSHRAAAVAPPLPEPEPAPAPEPDPYFGPGD